MPHLLGSNFPLKFFKCRPSVPDPVFATDGSACFDIHMVTTDIDVVIGYDNYNLKTIFYLGEDKSIEIPPDCRVLLPTGLIFDIPKGFSVRLHDRSGNALKSGFVCSNSEGIIDSDYVKETFFMVRNISSDYINIHNLTKICQGEMVADLGYQLKEINSLPVRGNIHHGFGSTS